jgi:hypothetical protein|tara:strand:- start:148 stop:303 length:156 start_codon:yes stop_codon:yes gene_type:complete
MSDVIPKEMIAKILQVPVSFLGVNSDTLDEKKAEEFFVSVAKEPWEKISET